MVYAVMPREAFLPHRTLDLDIIQTADSIAARAIRIKRVSQPSATLPTRRAAKDELRALIKEARALVALL